MTDPDQSNASPDTELIRSVWEEARELIKRLEGSTVQRFSVEAGNTKIEIERGMAGGVVAGPPPMPVTPGVTGDGAPPAEVETGHAVVAPLVGTFYRAPQPGSPPFVEEGDTVDAGQTIGIVEAMKLMNQVQTDVAGRVARIVASDGAWVEFEEPLMYIEPSE